MDVLIYSNYPKSAKIQNSITHLEFTLISFISLIDNIKNNISLKKLQVTFNFKRKPTKKEQPSATLFSTKLYSKSYCFNIGIDVDLPDSSFVKRIR